MFADTCLLAKLIQVTTTTASRAAALRISGAAVKQRLAACAQVIGPVHSIYHWQGNIETAREWVCLMKTTRSRFRDLARTIEALHSYDTPEITVIPIVGGSRRYLTWISASLRPPAVRRSRRSACR